MKYIGKIDISLYYEISHHIITDEVVLTDKQREHIMEKHPEVLSKFESYFTEIVEKPDFILKDKSKENTALLIKTIEKIEQDMSKIESANMVLRLAVEGDDEGNKNSIITCIQIGENRLKSYINNGKIIYKRE